MSERNYLREVSLAIVVLAILVVPFAAVLNPDGHWIGVYYAAPISLAGLIALLVALLAGARRLWLFSLPIVLVPLAPIVLVWAACEFSGDCI